MKNNNDDQKKGPSKGFIRIIIYFASAVAIFFAVALGMHLYEKNLDKITANKTFQKAYSVLPTGDSEVNLPEEFKQAYEDHDDMFQFGQNLGSSCRYGVFLSEKTDVKGYDVLVVDAQNYTKEEILDLNRKNGYVLSYINIGSIENFRPYYQEYENLTLKEYENWEEEKWVDVTSERWQEFILDELAKEILDKGVDGFFVDNCDVYYQYQDKKTLEGVARIMKGLVDTGKPVIMNGGDTFLEAYCEEMGDWYDVITGINQETVISRIYWDTGEFGLNDEEEKEYFTEYVQKYSDKGAYVFLLEYVTDDEIAEKVKEYCKEKNYAYYISDSLELD
ncbi:MAG: endo alpha-1,4 polygalactosaminidase [Lachnospiraceae bacterium]|nr:endo alpha-1,4 polygalactosaminidase [Lachnospiraceae bacterium]